MPTPTNLHYPGTPGTTLYGGRPTPSAGTLITTLQLVNTSASELASGFVSPMVGLPLKQGDLPSGEYPTFNVESSGESVAATIYSDTSWPDGSKKFCGVLLRMPVTVSGSGSRIIEVKSGGSAPAASSRTLSDLTAADLKVELTGVTNLSGTWVASLNTAITDATDIVVIGDGPAGKVWRIGGDFKQGGTAHGQLYCWHYVAALQDASGGLLGIRYLGRVAQPFTDVTSPAPAKREFTAVLKSGATTLRTLQGTQAGETLSSTITLPHYSDFYTCGADGRWDFVQGGGSASADCTVRVQHDKTYFTKTRLVPPYDLAQTVNSSASVNYNPQCKALAEQRYVGASGPRIEIGVLPGWQVKHLITQSAVDERGVRVSGLASGGWRTCLRQSTTKQPPAVVDVQPSYTGLGTAQPTWLYRDVGNSVGVNPTPDGHLWSGELSPDHRWAACFYPYLISGEPQYLDMLVEHATEWMLRIIPGGNSWQVGGGITGTIIGSWAGERNPTIAGVTYKGAGVFFREDLYRMQAWGSRDIAQAAAIYPDVCPSGTEMRKYLLDIVASNFDALDAYNNALPQSWRDSGLVSFLANGASDANYESPWALGYLSNSVCHQASILAMPKVIKFRQHVAKIYSSLHSISDIACMGSYRMSQWKGDGTRVESASDLVFNMGGTLTASTADSRFTVADAWNPTNGDVIAFTTASVIGDADTPFAAATKDTRFYVVNASGKTFQLAATPGGSPITVTSNVTITAWLTRLQNASPLFSYEGANGPGSMVSEIYSAIRHHEACGDTVVNGARIAQDANKTEAGVSYNNIPTNAMAVAYPG